MKITVWTLASDDDNGTQAQVFVTEHEAQTAYYNAVFELDGPTQRAAKKALDEGDYDELHEIGEDYLEGGLDTYSIDSPELEIPDPKPAPAQPLETSPEDQKYIDKAREQWARDGEIEVDENAVVSRGDDPGAYVQAWVWVADDEETEQERTTRENIEAIAEMPTPEEDERELRRLQIEEVSCAKCAKRIARSAALTDEDDDGKTWIYCSEDCLERH